MSDRLVRIFADLAFHLKAALIICWRLLKRLPGFVYTVGFQTFYMLLHCCCFMCFESFCRKPKFTEDDKGRYFRLRKKALRVFSQTSEEDEKQLHLLFTTAFPGEDSPRNRDDSRWEALGFQTSNPRLDIRGGGLMAINQLRLFLQRHPQEAKMMRTSTKRKQFVLACNSIRITFFLRQVFQFDHVDAIGSNESKSMKQSKKLKNLCNFLCVSQDGGEPSNPDESNEAVFDHMHHALLIQTFGYWQQVLEHNPSLSVLHVSKAEFNVEARFLKAIQARVFKSFEEFIKTFRGMSESAVQEQDETEVRRLSQ